MKLGEYLKRFNFDQRAHFALQVGTTVGHLNNVVYGTRVASAALAKQIALATQGQVREWDLRPGDWHLIWPELGEAADAPPVGMHEARHAA